MKQLEMNHIENILMLTPTQAGMLFFYLQNSKNQLYSEQLRLDITGEIHLPHFEKAWEAVIPSNEMLRSIFCWDKLEKPSQIILKEYPCQIVFYDRSHHDPEQKKTRLEEIKEKDRHHPFDLEEVPFRITSLP